MKKTQIENATIEELQAVVEAEKLTTKATSKAGLTKAVTLHFFPQKKEDAKDEAVELSKRAKKAKAEPHAATALAMGAIRALVESGSEAVTYKENASGSVMWVKVVEHSNTPIDKAVLGNLRKATDAMKGMILSSFTLCSGSGTVGAWWKLAKKEVE